ncbi:MAG TPA: peptide chain release factor N(5)-glutamine methyltransferase [Anaerolineales bacterium]|nr:peptide chain release factor N(5)-glutamine methyltransferase [Anaerolineales bacterium]
MNFPSVTEALLHASAQLSGETAALEGQLLLASVLRQRRAWLKAYPETLLDSAQWQAFCTLVARRSAGEPLPYILGSWEFYGRSFALNSAVLIPRPETELLVETALQWAGTFPSDMPLQLADVGTGSGCIAVTLAAELPQAHVLATDISPAALQVAQQNARAHHTHEQINFQCADLLAQPYPNLHGLFSNPPYLTTAQLDMLEVARYEPHSALASGKSGLELIERLLQVARVVVRPLGLLLIEIAAERASESLALAQSLLPGWQVQLLNDYAGLPRLLWARPSE